MSNESRDGESPKAWADAAVVAPRRHRLRVDLSERNAAVVRLARECEDFDVQMVHLPMGDYFIDSGAADPPLPCATSRKLRGPHSSTVRPKAQACCFAATLHASGSVRRGPSVGSTAVDHVWLGRTCRDSRREKLDAGPRHRLEEGSTDPRARWWMTRVRRDGQSVGRKSAPRSRRRPMWLDSAPACVV
jgi:hypothetical protein